jgi:hypothetical protein
MFVSATFEASLLSPLPSYTHDFMSKRKTTKKRRGNRRKAITTPERADRSIVTREFSIELQLVEAKNGTQTVGYTVWGTTLAAHPDFKEMAGLYKQCRVTGISSKYSPSPMVTTASGPMPTTGAVYHDPTSDMSVALDPLDYLSCRGAKAWSSEGNASRTGWMRCNYRPRLVNTMNFSASTQTMSPGEWIASEHMTDLSGQTIFTSQTTSRLVNSTVDVIVLQIIMCYVCQFKDPERTIATVFHTNLSSAATSPSLSTDERKTSLGLPTRKPFRS